VQPYSVTYKNVSAEKITETHGLWGEYFINPGGNFDPYNGYPKQGGFTNGYIEHPILDQAGAR
jgi:hypothetical protein